MEGGVVTERGPHHKLILNSGLYSRLYQEQFRVALQAAG